jgi:plasmid stability protein
MLPADLRSAEAEARAALERALKAEPRGRWTVEMRFEGLRMMPVALRLSQRWLEEELEHRLLFPDAGATALARRDAPSLAPLIGSFSDQRRLQGEGSSSGVLLLVGAGPSDYEEVEGICTHHTGAVVLLNPVLEDGAVGIGSVARERRRGFLAGWEAAYALIPQADSALRRAWPATWQLYRLDPDGYRAVASFERKPDGEQRDQALADGAGQSLGATLRSVDRFIEGLQN